MKNLWIFCLSVFMLNSCVELPDLLPNGTGEDSDMVIVEYSSTLNNALTGNFLVVDDNLSIRYYFNGSGCDGTFDMQMIFGNILMTLDGKFRFLEEGDLVGGLVDGTWGNNGALYSTMDFFWYCHNTYYLPEDQDVAIGIRFRDSNLQWHYGWVVLYLDTTEPYELLNIKAVGYNKKAGTNVRIGH
ncbi:MAG: hypothetical protein R2728_06145 [Chitinophagales bacterium]